MIDNTYNRFQPRKFDSNYSQSSTLLRRNHGPYKQTEYELNCCLSGDNLTSQVDSRIHNSCMNIFADTVTDQIFPESHEFELLRSLSTFLLYDYACLLSPN